MKIGCDACGQAEAAVLCCADEAALCRRCDAAGAWRVVNGDVGFPAGKNKTMLIDLSPAAGARRLRLRTNLEIY
jgi:hypothetical protein